MKEMSNTMAGLLLGFVIGVIMGEVFYYFTDQSVFFLVVIFMTIIGGILGSKIDIKEKTGRS